MIKIDFDDTFEQVELAKDFPHISFYSPGKNGVNVLLKIRLSLLVDPLLPNVYNLAFGPVSENEDIDDTARISHVNLSKLFSTILLFSINFLQINPLSSVGVDGSTDARAYLYHRMFQTNRHASDDIFATVGIDWHVKLLRSGVLETDEEGYPVFNLSRSLLIITGFRQIYIGITFIISKSRRVFD